MPQVPMSGAGLEAQQPQAEMPRDGNLLMAAAIQSQDPQKLQSQANGGFFSWLLGGAPKSKLVEAPKLSAYPSDVEAEEAKKYGFGYGSGNESYIGGQSARVLGEINRKKGSLSTFIPTSGEGSYLDEIINAVNDETRSKNIDLNDPKNADIKNHLGNTYARAALAINRIPIAALGFDPSRIVMDVKMQDANVAGAYSRKYDAIYSNLSSPSNMVHESIHRGLEKLRDKPELREAFRALPREETVVRYIMATQAGDPEKGSGDLGDRQRESALTLFKGLGERQYKEALDTITKAAQDEIAKRRLGGPR